MMCLNRMEFVATFDYVGMSAHIQMTKIAEGWRITLSAQKPKGKYSHFIIPVSGNGSSIDVPPGAPTTLNIAEPRTMVYWRIQSLGDLMQNYKLHFDFSGPMPKLKLEQGVVAPLKPANYVTLLEYAFKDSVVANFKLYKSKGEMKVKTV